MHKSKLGEIYEGFKNLILDNEEALASHRKSICDTCPLNDNGICSSKRELNGVKGCGCVLKAKQRSKNSKCPLGKW